MKTLDGPQNNLCANTFVEQITTSFKFVQLLKTP